MPHSRAVPAGQSHGPAAILLALMVFAVPSDAQAYLDPGTGTVIVQAIVAALAGVAFTLKIYWRQVKAFLRRTPAETPESSDAPSSESDPQGE